MVYISKIYIPEYLHRYVSSADLLILIRHLAETLKVLPMITLLRQIFRWEKLSWCIVNFQEIQGINFQEI